MSGKDVVVGDIEYGTCEVCGQDNNLVRTYYRYTVECSCHFPSHFEVVRHCKECTPAEPAYTIIDGFTVPTANLMKKEQYNGAINSR